MNQKQKSALSVSAEQIDTVFEAAFGIPARAADKQIVEIMGGTRQALAEYMWDHWMGEPRSPSVKRVLKAIHEQLD